MNSQPDPGAGKLSIIIPAYNESQTIRQLSEKLLTLESKKEIIVVDDGSTDGTREILEGLVHPDLKVVRHPSNRGKGAAIQTALSHCGGDFILIQDADLDQEAQLLEELLRPVREKNAGVVFGSRFLGQKPKMKKLNYWANRFLSFFASLLYGKNISDIETCFKVFRSDILRSIKLRSQSFTFEVEVTAKILKKGFEITEIPIREEWYRENYHASKKLCWVDGVKAFAALAYYRFFD